MEIQPVETKDREVVIKEPPLVTVGPPISSSTAPSTASTVSTEVPVVVPVVVPAVPVVKAKRANREKQRLNYLVANARRVQILAEAKQSSLPSPPPTQSNEVSVALVKVKEIVPPPLRYYERPLPTIRYV
ncbi:hypothetical protein T492DRAFT_843409 [Pavlovales sp. CCMP2436]|nr:hypothetical protein T492DRAFT_843409 [Pavlovales sp. CCMP2436]